MPDVGLLTASEPVPSDTKVVIRFSVEAGELPVYNESYDVDTLAQELLKDEAAVIEAWTRRLLCVIGSRARPGFSAALTRCLIDGKCCDYGHVEDLADPAQPLPAETRSPAQGNL